MNTKTLLSASILLSSVLLPTAGFAAYGGGGGSSSISSSSLNNTSVLTRDVCDTDYSNSYYDGTCGTKPDEKVTPMSSSFSTQSVKKPSTFIFKTETKNKLTKMIQEQQKINKQDLKMPLRYQNTQNKIDVIMNPREMLSKEERLQKAIKLFEKTELILEKRNLSPKIELIISYLQQRVLNIIQNAGSI